MKQLDEEAMLPLSADAAKRNTVLLLRSIAASIESGRSVLLNGQVHANPINGIDCSGGMRLTVQLELAQK